METSRLVVGIATHHRPAILTETIAFLAKQTRQPDKIFVTYAAERSKAETNFFEGDGL